MRGEVEANFVVEDMNIGMMAFLFGNIGNRIDKIDGGEEILEGKFFGNHRTLVIDLPGIDFPHIRLYFAARERLHASAFARNTFFLVKFHKKLIVQMLDHGIVDNERSGSMACRIDRLFTEAQRCLHRLA